MQRHLTGILAIFFLATAAVVFVRGGDDTEFLMSVCMRVGLVLAAIWLAYRQLQQLAKRVPAWLLAVFGSSLLLIAVRPKLFWLLIPVLLAVGILQFVGWIFKPLPNPKRGSQPASPKRKR